MTNQNGNTYLVHHGITGQRWGKRNGPPYPLNESAKSAAEKKSAYKVNKKELTDEQKSKIKKGVAVGASATAALLATYGLYKTGNLDKAVSIGKEAAIKALNGTKAGIKTGVKKGIEKGPEMITEKIVEGAMILGVIEVADLMTNSAATNTLLRAYNDVAKKDARVNTQDLDKIRKKNKEN